MRKCDMRSLRGASKEGSASNMAHLHNCEDALNTVGESVRYWTAPNRPIAYMYGPANRIHAADGGIVRRAAVS